MRRILHVLAQRPGRTGSGVTLEAIVRETAVDSRREWDQYVVVGVPADDEAIEVGGLDRGRIHPLRFGPGGDLPFPVPGMSDVMPYPSTVFREMTPAMVEAYCDAWRGHLARVADAVRPDVIHVHHLWLVGSLIEDAIPGVPVVGHCHATGLRQMQLVPHLAERVRRGNARHQRFAVLHPEHADQLAHALQVSPERIAVVGAGVREDLFHATDVERVPHRIVYAGKLSASKGLFELLDAVRALRAERPTVELHVAGGGSGDEADALRARLADPALNATYHGFVQDHELVELMASGAVFVLPSYYEGLPLVLVEAAACGCRLVATSTAGVRDVLAPHLVGVLEEVARPPMASVDVPMPDGLPEYVARLEAALKRALDAGPPDTVDLAPFRWSAVAARIHALWRAALEK